MHLQVKLRETAEITYLKKFNLCFDGQKTARNVNVTFSVGINTEITSMTSNIIAVVYGFSRKNARKWQKKHIYRIGNKNQRTARVYTCSSDYGKNRIAFLECLKMNSRYTVFI